MEAGRGDRVAIPLEDQKVTDRQLQVSVNKLGSALQALGHVPSDSLKRQLIKHCRDRIVVYKLPREIAFVEGLPRALPAPEPGSSSAGFSASERLRERANS